MGDTLRVFLGMPGYDGRAFVGSAQSFFHTTSRGGRYEILRSVVMGSALGQVFNKLWAAALSSPGVTHFAMLHNDLAPDHFWLDTLMEELERTGADLVSAVAAIKDEKGLTSTAVGNRDDRWHYRRLTIRELDELPETFGIDEIPDEIKATSGYLPVLLCNTGCWVCDLRRPWWRELDPDGRLRYRFTMEDRVTPLPDGRYAVEFAPEDWLFSRDLADAGGVVLATKKVKTVHFGGRAYPSWGGWGELDHDTESDKFFGAMQEIRQLRPVTA